MSQYSTTLTIDTHVTAALVGLLVGEVLSYISFDIRLVSAMVRKRQLRAMPVSFLIVRLILFSAVVLGTFYAIPLSHGQFANQRMLHWLRAFFLPPLCTSTSAILGYRAVILHFERPRTISALIHTLLAIELLGGIIIMILAVADPDSLEPHQKLKPNIVSISAAWIVAPVMIAIVIDAIFTLIVVIPILRQGERPKRGEVLHMLLSDAVFFGIFSIVVKAIAIGVTVKFAVRNTNPYLPVRVEAIASAIFACRVFRGGEEWLKGHRERRADPKLGTIEVFSVYEETSKMAAEGDERQETEGSLHVKVRKAEVTVTEC